MDRGFTQATILAFLVSFIFLFSFPAVRGASVSTEGLEFKEVQPTFLSGSIRFTTDYLNKTLTPKQVFVPDQISDKATLPSYNYVEAPTGKRVEWTGYTYDQYVDYGTEPLNDLLGRGGSDATSGSSYPTNDSVNYFQIGAYASNLTDLDGSIRDVFDYKFVEENPNYTVFWNIDVRSHYEHLIIDYKLYFNDTEGNYSEPVFIHSWQDVYSGFETERLPASASARRMDSTHSQQSITADNLYEGKETESFFIAHEKNTNISNIDFGGLNHSSCDLNYPDVQTEMDKVNTSSKFRISDTSNYKFTCYNVTLPADSKKTLKVTFQEPLPESRKGDKFGQFGDYKHNYFSYLVGSLASFTVNSSTEWQAGTFTNTTESNGILQLISYAYDVSEASYTDSLNVSAQDGIPYGMSWNSDGSKMYMVGRGSGNIYEYSCSAYDVSSCSYTDSLDISAQDGIPSGMSWNSDGSKMYMIGNGNDNIYEYSCSAYDVSSCSYTDSLDVSAQDAYPYGMSWNSDGSKMYMIGSDNDNVYEYSCSAYDVSSCSYTDSLDVSAQGSPRGMSWNSDGSKMYMGGGNDNIYEYSCSAYDVSSCSYTDSLDISAQDGNPTGMSWNSDGSKMYMIGYDNDNVYEYFLESYSSGSYTSKTFSASEEKAWQNVTAGGVENGYLTNLTVQARDSGGSIVDTQTITNVLNGSNTYTLDTLSSSVNVSFKWDFTSGSSPSVDNTTIQGETANAAPSLTVNVPTEGKEYNNLPITLNTTFTDPDGDKGNISAWFGDDSLIFEELSVLNDSYVTKDKNLTDGSYQTKFNATDNKSASTETAFYNYSVDASPNIVSETLKDELGNTANFEAGYDINITTNISNPSPTGMDYVNFKLYDNNSNLMVSKNGTLSSGLWQEDPLTNLNSTLDTHTLQIKAMNGEVYSNKTNYTLNVQDTLAPSISSSSYSPTCIEAGARVTVQWDQTDKFRINISYANWTDPDGITTKEPAQTKKGTVGTALEVNKKGIWNIKIYNEDLGGNTDTDSVQLDVRESGSCGGGGGGGGGVSEEEGDFSFSPEQYVIIGSKGELVEKTITIVNKNVTQDFSLDLGKFEEYCEVTKDVPSLLPGAVDEFKVQCKIPSGSFGKVEGQIVVQGGTGKEKAMPFQLARTSAPLASLSNMVNRAAKGDPMVIAPIFGGVILLVGFLLLL